MGSYMAQQYAFVVRIENVLLFFLLAEISHLNILTRDIANAYLNAYTNEKVYTIAGPEFGSRSGQIMMIEKAICGLKISIFIVLLNNNNTDMTHCQRKNLFLWKHSVSTIFSQNLTD